MAGARGLHTAPVCELVGTLATVQGPALSQPAPAAPLHCPIMLFDRRAMTRLFSRPGPWMLAAALAATLACGPAAAQWKWRDKTGIVQYSDLPPPTGTSDADILQRPVPGTARRATPAASAASAPLLVPRAAEAASAPKPSKSEEEAAARKKADDERIAQMKLDNCSRANAQMKALEGGQRMSRINAKGEREYLDDKGRAEEVQRTQGVIAADCKR